MLTTARFADNHYTVHEGKVSILALGNWRRWMAPPSIAEFVLTLTVRLALGAVCPTLRERVHMGTKGCPCDFDPILSDVRHKVLSHYLCAFCRVELIRAGQGHLIPDIETMLSTAWLGSPGDPTSPAGVTAGLGYDLFIAKGLRSTIAETARTALRQDAVKQLLTLTTTVVSAITIALLLLILGLKR